MKRMRINLGDIYCIPLPDEKVAFARLYKEYTLVIYKSIYSDISELPLNNEYMFFAGVYKDLLQDGEWKVVANRPFNSDEEAWPPPQCIKNKNNGKYSLYYKGNIIPST